MGDRLPLYRVLMGGVVVAGGLWLHTDPRGLGGLASAVASTVASVFYSLGLVAFLVSKPRSGAVTPVSPIAAGSVALIEAVFGPPGSFASDNKAVVVCCGGVFVLALASILHRQLEVLKRALGIPVSRTGRMRRFVLNSVLIAAITHTYTVSAALAYDGYACRERRALLVTWAFGCCSSVLVMLPAMFGRGLFPEQMGRVLTVANGASATLVTYLVSLQLGAKGAEAVVAARVASGLSWLMLLLVLRGCEMVVGIEVMWPVAEFIGTRMIAPACRLVGMASIQAFRVSYVMVMSTSSRLISGMKWLVANLFVPIGLGLRAAVVAVSRRKYETRCSSHC